MFTSPGAIAFSTPYFQIHWYGIILAIAFLVGQFLVLYIAKKEYNDTKVTDTVYEFAFCTLLSGILGARLYYVLVSWNYYSHNLNEIIMVQNGGLSIHGGLIFGTLAAIIYCKIKKVEFLKYADLYGLCLPLAQAIGRWGNFFNSEAFGKPTILPWGVYIPEINRPEIYKTFSYFHPTFLYECLWDIFIFLILYFIVKKFYFHKRGVIFFSYLILYSIGRILVECIRIDSALNILGIPVAIYISVLIIIISIICLFILHKQG